MHCIVLYIVYKNSRGMTYCTVLCRYGCVGDQVCTLCVIVKSFTWRAAAAASSLWRRDSVQGGPGDGQGGAGSLPRSREGFSHGAAAAAGGTAGARAAGERAREGPGEDETEGRVWSLRGRRLHGSGGGAGPAGAGAVASQHESVGRPLGEMFVCAGVCVCVCVRCSDKVGGQGGTRRGRWRPLYCGMSLESHLILYTQLFLFVVTQLLVCLYLLIR